MSDIEEMDSEQLNELESILYASIHYNDATREQEQQALDMELDAQSMPPPQQQHPEQKQQQKQQRFVSDKRIINNATSKPRYWAEAKSDVASDNGALKAKTSTSAESSNTEQPKEAPVAPPATNVDVVAIPKNKRPDANSPKKPTSQQKQPKATNPVKQLLQKQQQMRQALKMQQVQKRQQPQIQQKPPKPAQQQNIKANNAYDEPERFDQRLLVAIPSNCGPVAKRERGAGPFAKSNRKLEQFQKLATKKQKSMRAQTNKKLKQIKGQPIEMISLVDSSDHSDTDDVIIVPLPPVPIIDVDASDEEEAPAAYIEENAMDAADVSLSGGDCATTQMTVVRSVMHSPCSSVLSSDDFIVQKDTSRLIADRARATDEDLLVLTENAIRNAADPDGEDTTAEPEKAADTSSEYEFVPPSRLEEIKQNYRVDEQQFRALDVYESESDLTEGGIYCKAKQKFAPTIIRNIDSESESSDVEQVIEVNVNKTKRLRKRRASSTNQSQSDPNNEADKDNEDDDTDSDVDGVHATGVPGISRGMALERCKRKIRRISQRRSSESALQAVPRKMEDANDASSDSATEESLPTARQIAERLLMQKQANEKEQKQEKEQEEEREEEEDEAMDSVGSDANTEDEAEMHNVSEQMSKVFERIDKNTKLSQTKQIEPEKKPQIESITADQDLDQISDDELELSSETDAEADVVQVEHNMSELKEQLTGGDLVGWNEEMCRFYNDSWGGENFNLHRIQRAMSSLRSDWRVINADRFPTARKRSNLKCNNCFEMGHMRAKCPRPRKPVVCYTCGMPGHAEPRCPNAICLGCGAKQPLYVQKCNKCSIQSRMICQLCKMRGHSIDMCPDKWRRYHSTTRSNVELESRVQYRQKNCSYCAARGHLFEDCRQRIGEYRHTNYTQRIISHQKVYKDRPEPISYSSDLDNFFALDIPFHFNWSSEFSKNSIYARFLKAVGLPRPADKRKLTAPPMQMKLYTHDYVPNPAATAALGKAPLTTASVIIEELPAETQATPETVTEVLAVEAEVQPEAEAETDNNTNQSSSDVIATTVVKPTVPPHDLDSDSNYSFSEHFEVPAEKVSSPKPTKTGPMENLPDVIPLNSTADDNSDNNNDNDEQMSISGNNQGISMCVNSKATEDQPQSLPDLPSEAKIIMARDQTEYLFSPEGREFLATAAKQCNVNVRMDFKEYGYVLVIYGLKKDQEDLQIRLLRRNQEVMRKSSDFQSQKPPKRVDVLIRFMRDGINSLSSDLGNAKNHYHRIKQLEEMNTKNGFKQAERKRRLLNMILIGQAGLSNGSMHLDQLLSILKRLLDEHSGDENATPALRSEIEEHWRFIFSPNPHPNYDLLLENYSRLDTKNRMTVLNIEPAVLGLPNSCKRNRVASPPPPPPAWQQQQPDVNKMRSPKQRIISNEQQSPIPQAMPVMQQQQQQQNRTPKQRTQQKRQTRPMPPVWQHDEQQQQQPQIKQQQQQQQKQQQPQQKQLQQKQLQPNQKQNQQQQLQQRQQQQLHQRQQQQQLQQRQQQQQLQLHQRQQQQQQQLQLRQQQQHLKQQTHNSNMNKNRIQKQQRQQPYVKLAHGQQYSMPFNNPLQRVPNGLLLQRNPLQSQCVKLLDGMERGNRITSDATAPSVYWSRETMQHLDDLFKIPVNPETVERLHRVLERSRRGQLSHNDYRAVIKLKSLMVPH